MSMFFTQSQQNWMQSTRKTIRFCWSFETMCGWQYTADLHSQTHTRSHTTTQTQSVDGSHSGNDDIQCVACVLPMFVCFYVRASLCFSIFCFAICRLYGTQARAHRTHTMVVKMVSMCACFCAMHTHTSKHTNNNITEFWIHFLSCRTRTDRMPTTSPWNAAFGQHIQHVSICLGLVCV